MDSSQKASRFFLCDHHALTAAVVLGVILSAWFAVFLSRHSGVSVPAPTQEPGANLTLVSKTTASTAPAQTLPTYSPRVEAARRRALAAQAQVDQAHNDIGASREALQQALSDRDAVDAEITTLQTRLQRRETALTEAQKQMSPAAANIAAAREQVGRVQGALQGTSARSSAETLISSEDLKAAQAGVLDEQSDLAQGRVSVQTAGERLQAARTELAGAQSRRQQAVIRIQAALARHAAAEARLPAALRAANVAQQQFVNEEIRDGASETNQ